MLSGVRGVRDGICVCVCVCVCVYEGWDLCVCVICEWVCVQHLPSNQSFDKQII